MSFPDQTDRLILMKLSDNCRITYAQLAKEFDMSLNAIKKRVQKLIRSEIIQGFVTQLNPSLFNANHGLAFFKFKDRISENMLEIIGKHPNIIACGFGFQLNGTVVLIYRSNEELSDVSEFFQKLDNFETLEILPLAPDLILTPVRPLKSLTDLQEIDWLLLWHLRWNARGLISELSDITKIPSHTIRRRLKYLETNHLIVNEILINPVALQKGLMINIRLLFPTLTKQRHTEIDQIFRINFPNFYWMSWRAVNQPILVSGFQMNNPKELQEIENFCNQQFPECKIIDQFIGKSMKYFPYFYDQILEEKRNCGWFTSEQWDRKPFNI